MLKINLQYVVISCLAFNFSCTLLGSLPQVGAYSPPIEQKEPEIQHKTIRAIHILGNKLVTKEALLARIPYQTGDLFLPAKTGDLIRNLYGLQYFSNVSVETEDISDTEVDLYVIVEEKKKVEAVIYEGNVAVSEEEIEKELKLSEIPAMDEEELGLYATQIRGLYAQKNYHTTTIETELQPTERGTYIALFRICDGPLAAVRRVFFEGNECVPSNVLRKMIFTREEWLFGFMNKAGTYAPDMLDVDKFILENYYQSHGFLAARITDIQVDINEDTQEITVTYYVEEGPLFTVTSLSAPGNDILSEEQLISVLPIEIGQLYSKDFIREAIDRLRAIWGRYGYFYSDIEPVIIPDFETKTVDITFNSELGNKITLNRINIVGNQKTCDHVIRRMLTLREGQILSLPAMDASKARVEQLGYFDPQGGVDWKITKVSEDCVDLDLVLNEIKTGNINAQIGYGGADPQSPSTSIRIGGSVSDKNLFGTGIRLNLSASFSKLDRLITFNIFQPWLFNRPIGGGFGFYHRSSFYEDFDNISSTPREHLTGGDLQLVFALPGYPDVNTSITGGAQRIRFQEQLQAEVTGRPSSENELLQSFINQRFASGTNGFINVILGQDVRNHPMFPNKGYNWSFSTMLGVPTGSSTFGYAKGNFDVTWLTPLIGQYDLVLLLHGHAGVVTSLRDKLIPYRELYNIGGPGSVRGFEFGQIGPQVFNDSVGARKAFWVNAELIFSVTQDQSIRGVVFYDGGAGWDTPLTPAQRVLLDLPANRGQLRNNRFRYRHSIGFGIRLLSPAPIRVDWGFKLDRDKRRDEKFYEEHFSMNQEF